MAHEELKKQYVEDCKHHKEPSFIPEYFSGLNWREAQKLVGKIVEVSDDPDRFGWKSGKLHYVDSKGGRRFAIEARHSYDYYEYVRTCPETCPETHAHPTIEIGGVKLPKPEVEAPEFGTVYWYRDQYNTVQATRWYHDRYDLNRLNRADVHGTKSRAQAWADWWESTVLAAVRGGE